MLPEGTPAHIRSDNALRWSLRCYGSLGTKTLSIGPGSPWENGYCESFTGKRRDELLIGDIFYSLREAQVVIEQWLVYYNTRRPHLRLAIDRPRRSPSRQIHPIATRPRRCNNLSLSLVQKIGQARVPRGWAIRSPVLALCMCRDLLRLHWRLALRRLPDPEPGDIQGG